MKNPISRLLFALFFSLVLYPTTRTSNIIAQDTGGSLTAKVSDAESGEALLRATVYVTVDGKMKGGYTDAKGRITLRNIPASVYDVHVRYTGYQEKVIKQITIASGKTATVDVVMQRQARTTADVVVEARASRESEAAILSQRRNASQVSDGVSEEEIKRQSDNDAGQVLKRVSGVTLVGDKFVYVRGISERYNNTTLNGVSLASTESDKKAFSFDMFPAEFLQNASVLKSFTPDLPGNFAGGLVQLNTVDFPNGYALRFNVGSSGSDNLTGIKDGFSVASGSKTDWLGFDDGARSMPASLPATRTEMNELISQARAYYAGDRSEVNSTSVKKWESLGSSFNNGLWKRTSSTATPNSSMSVSFSNVYTPFDSEFGVIASLGYSGGVGLSSLERKGISSTRETLFDYTGSNWSRNVNLNALFNCALKVGSNHSISLRNVYNHAADEDAVNLNGFNTAQTRDLRLVSNDYSEKALFSTQLIGEHTLLDVSNMLVDWRVGLSSSSRNQPDYRRLRYSRDLNSTDLFVADIPYPGSQSGDGTSAGRFMSDLKDQVWTGALNVALPIAQAKVKVGAVLENRSREFNTRSFTYIQSKIFSRGAVVNDSVLGLSPEQIFAAENFGANGLSVSEDSKSSDSYTATEKLHAAYAMFDSPFEFFGLNLRIIAGARVEDNNTDLSTVMSFKAGTSVPDSILKTHLQTTDVLPAINLVYKATENQNIRMSASQTLTRPSLREFAPFAFYDFQSLALIQGNPRLTRALIQNYDLRWEYFPTAGEVFSVGVFYKKFKHAIEETIVPAASEIQRSFDNASSDAINYGLEIEMRKSLSFVSESMSNFLVNLNYSAINSQIEIQQGLVKDTRTLWGQSPYSVNAGLFYFHPDYKTSINLSYNKSGKRIVQVAQIGSFAFSDPHVYEMPRDQIDFSVAQPITDNINLRLSLRDLLNQPTRWEQGGVTVSSVQRGRSLSLSLSYVLK